MNYTQYKYVVTPMGQVAYMLCMRDQNHVNLQYASGRYLAEYKKLREIGSKPFSDRVQIIDLKEAFYRIGGLSDETEADLFCEATAKAYKATTETDITGNYNEMLNLFDEIAAEDLVFFKKRWKEWYQANWHSFFITITTDYKNKLLGKSMPQTKTTSLEKFLKEHGSWQEYNSELAKDDITLSEMEQDDEPADWLEEMPLWHNSPSGSNYWKTLAEKWETVLDTHKVTMFDQQPPPEDNMEIKYPAYFQSKYSGDIVKFISLRMGYSISPKHDTLEPFAPHTREDIWQYSHLLNSTSTAKEPTDPEITVGSQWERVSTAYNKWATLGEIITVTEIDKEDIYWKDCALPKKGFLEAFKPYKKTQEPEIKKGDTVRITSDNPRFTDKDRAIPYTVTEIMGKGMAKPHIGTSPKIPGSSSPAMAYFTKVNTEPVVPIEEPITPIKKETKMSKAKELVGQNKDALTSAARVQAGKILNKQAMAAIHAQLPTMAKALIPADKLDMAAPLAANAVAFAVKQYLPDNKKANMVVDMMVEAAAFQLVESFNLEKLVEDMISKVKLPDSVAKALKEEDGEQHD